MKMKIYICSTRFLTDENMDRYLETVCQKRRKKTEKLKNIEDKKRSLLAGVLLKTALKNEGVDYNNSSFSVDKNGKPYLSDKANIFYNLSHSGEYVVVAISDKEVGIDVQKIDKYNLKIAKRCFTEKEVLFVNQKNENKQAEAYTTIWTLKESYLKATGEGIRRELNSFETMFKEESTALVKDGEKKAYIEVLRAIEGYIISVCAFEKTDSMEIIMVNGKDLNT